MRIHMPVSSYYEWKPVPPDVDVSPEDIASGRVKPAMDRPGAWNMRVTVQADTHVDVMISEEQIIKRIVDQAMPQQGYRALTRRQAVEHEVAVIHMPVNAHHESVKNVEVHDDGPDEAMFRAIAAPYLTAIHGASQLPLISSAMFDRLLAGYLEPADHHAHKDHLHARFGLASTGKVTS